MLNAELIVLARALHVIAGIGWAGGTFMLAGVIVPMSARYADEGFSRWAALISRRVGPMTGISGLLTVLSGIYLFAALHASDTSTGGLVLRTGAVAALLAFATGLVSRATGRKLATLTEAPTSSALDAPAVPELARQIAGLRQRAAISSRVTAALLGLAVLSMALFRYAQIL
jgi:uncharacterized membrane protein